MARKSNLTNIAKKDSTRTKKSTATTKKASITNKSVTDKELKAKETVEKLLDGIDLTPKKREQVSTELEKLKGSEWLEEQVSILTEENEKLKKESEEAKINYKKLYEKYQSLKSGNLDSEDNMVPDSELTNNVKYIFNELQKNMLGHNKQRKRYEDVKIAYVLKNFLELFPFTSEIKKF